MVCIAIILGLQTGIHWPLEAGSQMCILCSDIPTQATQQWLEESCSFGMAMAWPNFKCYNNDFQGRVNSRDFREGIHSGRPKNAHTRTHHFSCLFGGQFRSKSTHIGFLRWGLLSKRYRQRTEWSYHGDSDFLSRSQASAKTVVIISECPNSWGESISLNFKCFRTSQKSHVQCNAVY